MSVLVGKNTLVLVQGLTGREGSFHAQQMLDAAEAMMDRGRIGDDPGQQGGDDEETAYEHPNE